MSPAATQKEPSVRYAREASAVQATRATCSIALRKRETGKAEERQPRGPALFRSGSKRNGQITEKSGAFAIAPAATARSYSSAIPLRPCSPMSSVKSFTYM